VIGLLHREDQERRRGTQTADRYPWPAEMIRPIRHHHNRCRGKTSQQRKCRRPYGSDPRVQAGPHCVACLWNIHSVSAAYLICSPQVAGPRSLSSPPTPPPRLRLNCDLGEIQLQLDLLLPGSSRTVGDDIVILLITAWSRSPPGGRTWSWTSGECRKSAGSSPPPSPGRFSVAAGSYHTCVPDGILEYSPAERVRRPAVPAESPILGFTQY
jgi:hypothetical protein